MKLSRSVTCLLFAYASALGTGIASGQDYPSKPVRMIATQPGGLTDVVARLIAPGLTASLGKQFIVDNRTAIVAVETAAKAPPDGYTILVNGSAFWLMPLLRDHVTWDPFRDFVPIKNAFSIPAWRSSPVRRRSWAQQ